MQRNKLDKNKSDTNSRPRLFVIPYILTVLVHVHAGVLVLAPPVVVHHQLHGGDRASKRRILFQILKH